LIKTQISAAVHRPPQASLPIPSTSKIPPYANMSEDIQSTAPSTPPKYVEGKKGMSQRRPVLTTKLASETFLEVKILSLYTASKDAGEEHNLQTKILQLRA